MHKIFWRLACESACAPCLVLLVNIGFVWTGFVCSIDLVCFRLDTGIGFGQTGIRFEEAMTCQLDEQLCPLRPSDKGHEPNLVLKDNVGVVLELACWCWCACVCFGHRCTIDPFLAKGR